MGRDQPPLALRISLAQDFIPASDRTSQRSGVGQYQTAAAAQPSRPSPRQKLLGHASIQPTGYVYADWDIDQLVDTMRAVLEGE